MTSFNKMNISLKHLKGVNYSTTGFTRASIILRGAIKLPVKIRHDEKARDLTVEFLVVDVPAAFNAILGRPLIHDAHAVVSTYHLTMVYMHNVGHLVRLKCS